MGSVPTSVAGVCRRFEVLSPAHMRGIQVGTCQLKLCRDPTRSGTRDVAGCLGSQPPLDINEVAELLVSKGPAAAPRLILVLLH